MAPPAFLLVFPEPGTGVTEEEFTDWYDNEHVPLRVDIPAFQNWTRWKAADGQKPTWAASYDLSSYEETLEPPYSRLAETRSEREKRILRNLDVLERRTYELMDAPFPPPSPKFDPKKPAPFVTVVSTGVKPEGEELLTRWYEEEHIPMFSKYPGWLRSRRFVLKDWSRMGVEGQTNQTPPPKYLTFHEWESLDSMRNPEFRKEWETPLKAEVDKYVTKKDPRAFAYYKHWEK